MIFAARPLPITNEVPFTIISKGPFKGALFFFNIFTPGTIPKFARRLLAWIPAFTLNTVIISPFSHSVKHLINGVWKISFLICFSGIELIIQNHLK